MPSENKLKVCLVAISLGRGGAERSTALLSQMLAMKGYDVHIVVLNDWVHYPYAGKLFNLGTEKAGNDSIVRRIMRFQKFRNYLKSEKFDLIIDNRTRVSAAKESYYLSYLYKGFRVIYVVRSANLSQYLPDNKIVARKMIERSTKVVGVSKHIAEKINKVFKTDKAVAIYNPMMPFEVEDVPKSDSEYILFLGRLEDKVKNISLLLDGYQQSALPEKNIRLKILGDGEDLEDLKDKTTTLGIANKVDFVPFTSEVYPYLKNAYFTVLTSQYEGFPRALVESLSVGTPVVSVDCVSGPSEIVDNGHNGLLIANHNAQRLAWAMDRMVSDHELYETCKKNSKESVAHLSLEHIAEEWDKILRNETNRS